MFVNKYVRCVAACLSLVCGCVYVNMEEAKAVNNRLPASDESYNFTVKSSKELCKNYGDVYVTTSGEKGILCQTGDKVFFVFKNDGTYAYKDSNGNVVNLTKTTSKVRMSRENLKIYYKQTDRQFINKEEEGGAVKTIYWEPQLLDNFGKFAEYIYENLLKTIGEKSSSSTTVKETFEQPQKEIRMFSLCDQ